MNKSDLKQLIREELEVAQGQSSDPVDTITMDIPLFIRMLEYAREDATEDEDLHKVTDLAISLTKEMGILTMDDYDSIVGEKNDFSIKEPVNEYLGEDLDLGHQDNEPGMLKGDLYKIGKYSMELYQMMDDLEGQGEVDFPHWWQSKIVTAKNMISGAKHYLDFELKEPQIDAMVDVVSKPLEENTWPKELTSRYSDEYRFELQKVEPTYKDQPGRAKYHVIDIESGELKGTPAFGKVESLMAFADDLIKPQGGTQSTNLGEIDMNDTVLMKMRADKFAGSDPKAGSTIKGTGFNWDKNTARITFLQKERAQLMRDMEQEAEPEGGPIANEYGRKLNRIDAAIAKLSGRKEMTYDQVIAENNSYVRVSEPKFIKDKNNPNFLYVNFKYDTGGGVLTALGKETMSGQIRRLSSAEAMKQATALAKDLEAKYNLEDIDVYDKENGVVQIFAISDDFMDMDPNMLSEATKEVIKKLNK